MTPANIVRMAALKNLDIISVTDHNSCRNCPAVLYWAKQENIIAIPGMELCTQEEVHVLCLFAKLSDAMDFDEYVYSRLIKHLNKEEVFGRQEICDLEDNVAGKEPYLLINAAAISFEELGKLMSEYHGVYIPAHIDKSSNSLIFNLGFVPPDADFTAAEITDRSRLEQLCRNNPYLLDCNIITNSDAHSLGLINEAVNYLECESRSLEDILKAIAGAGDMEKGK